MFVICYLPLFHFDAFVVTKCVIGRRGDDHLTLPLVDGPQPRQSQVLPAGEVDSVVLD